jgi:hypothetical protein
MTISFTVYVPWFFAILAGVFIGLSLFYYTKQKSRINFENKRYRLEEKQEALIEILKGRIKNGTHK